MWLYLLCVLFGLAIPSITKFILVKLTSSDSKELYDQADAVTLNLVGGGNQSLWFNMGWWEHGGKEDFAEAASLLCRKVALAARLQPKQRICEVGYGSGDSTLLLAREFSPSSYTGFTSLASQHAIASRRTKEMNLDSTQVEVRRGDASTALASLEKQSVDAVLAVDCAFHFGPRQSFFTSAASILDSEGRLALTDLFLPSTPLSLFDSLALRLICLFANLPFENLLTASNYRSSLIASGFDADSIEMDDISEHVWPGFLGFVERREKEMGIALGAAWKGLRTYSKVVRWYSGVHGGKQRLRFYLISAKKDSKRREEEKKVY